jgi:hypothetical protein
MAREQKMHMGEIESLVRRHREEVDTISMQMKNMEEAARMRNQELI